MQPASDCPRPSLRAERIARYALLVLAIAGAIIALAPQGQIAPDLGTGIGDKAAHAVFAAAFGILAAIALPGLPSLVHLAVGLVLAIAVEVIQLFFDRAADFEDGVMTLLGAWAGFAFGRLVFGRRARS